MNGLPTQIGTHGSARGGPGHSLIRYHRGPYRPGFTLLEVLIATLLTTVLMATLWGIFQVYLALFDKGERLVWETQFEQAVLRQLYFDLQGLGIAPAPPPDRQQPEVAYAPAGDAAVGSTDRDDAAFLGSPPQASGELMVGGLEPLPDAPSSERRDLQSATRLARLPRRGLEGGGDWLEVFTLQHVPEWMAMRSAAETDEVVDAIAARSEETYQIRAPMLRRIRYAWIAAPGAEPEAASESAVSDSFESVGSADFPGVSTTESEVGFVRYEAAWEEPADLVVPSAAGEAPPTIAEDPRSRIPPEWTSVAPDSEQLAQVNSASTRRRDVYPALAGVHFRYFDGMDWHDRWSSHERGYLPVAVEIHVLHRPRAVAGAPVRLDRRPSHEPDPSSSSTETGEFPPELYASPIPPGENLLAGFDPSADLDADLDATDEDGITIHRLLVTWSSDHYVSTRYFPTDTSPLDGVQTGKSSLMRKEAEGG